MFIWRVQPRSTMPAISAPSTTSRPNRLAIVSSRNSSTVVQRRVVWPVESWPSLMMRAQPPVPGHPGHEAQAEGQHPDQGDRRQRGEMIMLGEEHRDRDRGQQFAHRPGGQHVAAELPVQHVVVLQDRQQGAERRGGEGQPDRHEVMDVPGRAQRGHHPDGQHRRHRPAGQRQPSRPLPQQPRVAVRTRPAGTGSRGRCWTAAVMLAVLPRPRPCGPMSTPPSRKMTTCGMRGPGSTATTSGASAATSATTNSVSSPLVTPKAPAASPGRPSGRRQGSPFPGQNRR